MRREVYPWLVRFIKFRDARRTRGEHDVDEENVFSVDMRGPENS